MIVIAFILKNVPIYLGEKMIKYLKLEENPCFVAENYLGRTIEEYTPLQQIQIQWEIVVHVIFLKWVKYNSLGGSWGFHLRAP